MHFLQSLIAFFSNQLSYNWLQKGKGKAITVLYSGG